MIKILLEFVEIRTKLASMLPMFIGIFYTLWLNYTITPLKLAFLIISMLCIDMATTALNNYFDYKRAQLKSGYHYDHHNPISSGKLKETTARSIIAIITGIGIISGLALVYISNILILILGVISFAAAVSYSFGPLPISRTPLGEMMSGFFMGFLIPVISGCVFIPLNDIFTFNYQTLHITFEFNLSIIVGFLFLGFPLFCLIANIMLANNTCDRSEDIENARYTLPVIIGTEKSTALFKLLFSLAYISILIGVVLHFLPLFSLLAMTSLYKTYPLMKGFTNHPDKHTTFVNAVKIFFIFSMTYLIGLIAAAFIV